MKNSDDKIIGAIIVILLVIILMALSSWIFMLLFNVIANYFGFMAIPFWISVCIVCLLTYLKPGSSSSK